MLSLAIAIYESNVMIQHILKLTLVSFDFILNIKLLDLCLATWGSRAVAF